MQTTPAPPLRPEVRTDDNAGAVGLFTLVARLYGVITGGHDGLGYNVQGMPSVTAIGADGYRRPVLFGYGQGEPDDTGREWRPAREVVEGGRLVARVLRVPAISAHVRGRYSVALEAAGHVEWVAIDIDAHARADEGHDGPRLAKERARRVLAQVLRALGCGGDRWPVIFRSPGGGFHVWIPITRGVGHDHRWPAAWAGSWVRYHLAACGVELRDGVCEVYPSGRRLRAPCGRGSVLLRVVRDDVTDPLALEPWPGTTSARTLWRRGGDPQVVRRVGPMLRAFLGEWERQRRTLADWLGRPEAAWDPDWGFLMPPGEKNERAGLPESYDRSQQVDDVSGLPRQRRGERAQSAITAGGAHRADPGSVLFRSTNFSTPLTADLPPYVGEDEGDPPSALLKGPAFWRKVERLITSGVTEPSSRHDAVLTLCFAWGAAAGLSDSDTVGRIVGWCGAHAHGGSRLAGSPLFTRECIREAAQYLRSRGPRWPFRGARGRGSPVALGVLAPADLRVLELVDARVRAEAGAVMSFLAGRADDQGTIADPVEWATGLAERLLGDRRVKIAGKRHRRVTMAIAELARLGLITKHSGHAVGRHGRRWSVWYRFGSGELPARVVMLRSAWELAGRRETLRPSLYTYTRPEDAAQGPQNAPGATPADLVELRQVAARGVAGGLLIAVTDGTGPVRVIPVLDVVTPARPGYRAAWWLRQWRGRPPTVGEFAHAHEGAITVSRHAAERVARLAKRAACPVSSGPAVGSYDRAGSGARVAAAGQQIAAGQAVDLDALRNRAGNNAAIYSAGPADDRAELVAEVVSELAGQGGAVELYAVPVPVAADLAGPLGSAWAAWERAQSRKNPGPGVS